MKLPNPRLNQGLISLLALWILPILLPDARWIAILRGDNRLDTELRQAQARGYYETLLTGPTDPATATLQGGVAVAKAQPAPPGWKPFAESGIVEPIGGYLRWRMKPNLRTVWNGAQFSTNSLGYRTPEVIIPKPPGTYRIVVLGSSNTMGHGVEDDEMFVRLLEDWLNSTEAGLGRRVEVINLAVSSDSPSQSLLRLQHDVPALEPDWILNDVTVLDYSLEELHIHSIVRSQKQIPFGYIRTILLSAGVSPSDTLTEFSAKLVGSTEAVLQGAYEGWSNEAKALGIPMTLMHLPRTDAKIDNRNLKRMAERLAGRYSLQMIDLTGVYQDRKIAEYRLSPWDKHPSVLGHRLIFEGLRDALIRLGGGPELPFGVEVSRENGEIQKTSVNPA